MSKKTQNPIKQNKQAKPEKKFHIKSKDINLLLKKMQKKNDFIF